MKLIKCDICGTERDMSPQFGGEPFRIFEYAKENDRYMQNFMTYEAKDLCPDCHKKVMESAYKIYDKLKREKRLEASWEPEDK